MTSKIKDGWHTIYGRKVYVEGGMVRRGIKEDRNHSQAAAYVYRASRRGGWDKEDGLSVAAFRAGIARGTIELL